MRKYVNYLSLEYVREKVYIRDLLDILDNSTNFQLSNIKFSIKTLRGLCDLEID